MAASVMRVCGRILKVMAEEAVYRNHIGNSTAAVALSCLVRRSALSYEARKISALLA